MAFPRQFHSQLATTFSRVRLSALIIDKIFPSLCSTRWEKKGAPERIIGKLGKCLKLGKNCSFIGDGGGREGGEERKFSLVPSHSRAHTFTPKRHFMKKMGDGNWETSEANNFFFG